ncbi:MAG: 5'/3'-nucleotidase SurE [Actinomycetota bacterium]
MMWGRESRRFGGVGLTIAFVGVLALSGCSGESGSPVEAESDTTIAVVDSTPVTEPTSETTAAPEPFMILVTNDDGVGADGIDALVNALVALDNVMVTVVAPAENQSGSGGKTTDGPLEVRDAATKSGYPAKAVVGFPADSIVWALYQGGIDFGPDLLVAGINEGQNYSFEIAPLSGTVGAARAAAQRNVPSVAVSQGLGEPPNYPASVEAIVAWIEENRAELEARSSGEPTPTFVSINVPTCAPGTELRGVVEVPMGSLEGTDYNATDCASTVTPDSDVTGFQNGYGVVTELAVAGAPFTD